MHNALICVQNINQIYASLFGRSTCRRDKDIPIRRTSTIFMSFAIALLQNLIVLPADQGLFIYKGEYQTD